jgi:hypothetical protein
MATLSAEQILDLEGDLDILIGEEDSDNFTTAEVNRLFTRSNGDYDATAAYIIRQLLAQTFRLTKYTQGKSSEDKTVITENLRKALAYWEQKAGIYGGRLSSGSIKLGLDQVASDD